MTLTLIGVFFFLQDGFLLSTALSLKRARALSLRASVLGQAFFKGMLLCYAALTHRAGFVAIETRQPRAPPRIHSVKALLRLY
jgi:hypothetical protein